MNLIISTSVEDGAARTETPADPGHFAISSDDLGHRYGRSWAVRGLDLRVPRGSVYGFLGLNGAGKSTTMRMIMGLLPVHQGHLLVAGSDSMTHDLDVKSRVGYVPDTPVFYDWMTAAETCAMIAHYRKSRWDVCRELQLLKDFDIDPRQRTSAMSKGQKARLSLVFALSFNPEILVLDEPTLGLDPIARKQFTESVLREYAGEGHTVFISSHLINEIAGIVDYVGILKDGRLAVQEPAEQLQSRVQRVELYFENAAPAAPPAGPPPQRYQATGREAILTYHNAPQLTAADFSGSGATEVRISPLALEDIFIEIAGATPAAEKQP